MDSLGGILTGGLLGNPVLSTFNLTIFKFIDIVVHVSGHSVGWTDFKEDAQGYLSFKIHLFKNEYTKNFNISNNKINIVIKMFNVIKKIKDRVLSVKFSKEIKIDNIKVKFNAKN